METIRYSLIGREDLKTSLGSFEVQLADGRVVMLRPVDIGYYLSDVYADVTGLPTPGIAGRLARVSTTQTIYIDTGAGWTPIGASWTVASGRLTYDTGTGFLLFAPYKGNLILINGQRVVIPDAGISLAPAGLLASTVYYIYAYLVGSTLTLEASVTGHATQIGTGVEIKTGDPSRTLVGQARTGAAVIWVDSDTQGRHVLSWFNRRTKRGTNRYTVNRTTAEVSFVEVNSEIRNSFLTWPGECVSVTIVGIVGVATAVDTIYQGIAFDGIIPENNSVTRHLPSAINLEHHVVSHIDKTDLAEGYHYVTLVGATANASHAATWTGNTTGATPANAATYLHYTIQG